MEKREFTNYEAAEQHLTEHMPTCEFQEVRLPCHCIVSYPCKSCGAKLTKTGAQALARMGALCATCGAVARAEHDRGHVAKRGKIAGEANG